MERHKEPQFVSTDEVSPAPAARPIRIGIVDDYLLVRAGLERLFSRYADLQVVGGAGNGGEALALVHSHAPDVLVLDIAMPQESAVDVLEEMLKTAPHTKVLVFSAYPEEQYALPLIRLGARAYVDKASPLPDVVAAVRAVAAGDTFFSTRVQAMLAQATCAGVAEPGLTLTVREFQVFLRLAAGETVTDIAAALSLSEVTISSHRSRLLKKLRLRTNSHLTRYAVENRFLY